MKTCDLCKSEIPKVNDENEIIFNIHRVVACEKCYQRMCDIVGKLNITGFNSEIYINMMDAIKK